MTTTTENWYGSFTDGWRNEQTNEKIVFKKPRCPDKDNWQVWLYKTPDERRGTKLASAPTQKRVISEASDIAHQYDTTSYW